MNKIVEATGIKLNDMWQNANFYLAKAITGGLSCLSYILIVIIAYLIIFKPNIIFYLVCCNLICLLGLTHVYLGKYPNLTFSVDPKDCSFNKMIDNRFTTKLKLFTKLSLLQLQLMFFSNWLRINILTQHQANINFATYDLNSNLNDNVLTIINSFTIWAILVSGLLILGIYKYKLQFHNFILAKCLQLKLNNTKKNFIYNTVLGIELYSRTASTHLFSVVIAVNFFQHYAVKYSDTNLFAHPRITAFFIIFSLFYIRPIIRKLISFLVKRTNLNFVKINLITISIFSIIVFILLKLSLQHLEQLNLLRSYNHNYNVSGLMKANLVKKFSSILLILGINIIITFSLITDVTIQYLSDFKLKTVYLASLLFPLTLTIVAMGCGLPKIPQQFFLSIEANIFTLVLAAIIFDNHYNKVHHLFCSFKITLLKEQPSKQIRYTFEHMLQKIVNFFALNLNFYYNFGGLFILILLLLGAIASLPIITILLINQLKLIKNKQDVLIYGT